MRLAVFSDIHGNYEALKSILEDIKNNNIDKIICLGDTIAIGPKPKECLDLIKQNDILYLLGNHELYHVRGFDIEKMNNEKIKHTTWVNKLLNEDDLLFLKNCPIEYKLELNGKYFSFSHYLIKDLKIGFPFMEFNPNFKEYVNSHVSDYYFIGHDHFNKEIEINSKKIFIVGSSGCVYTDETSYYVIDIDKKINIDKKMVKYNRDNFLNDIKTCDYPCKEDLIYFYTNLDEV